ncbi:MAG: acetyl-CoA carboxylase biotin carboxyl carrier protein subunit [Candidatus Nitrosocosmicus sp.]
MEIKVEDIKTIFHGEIVEFDKNNNLVLKIDDKKHELKIISFKSNILEFIFDNSYYEIRVLESTNTDLKILLNGNPLTLKKHSKLAEIIEKSAGRGGGGGSSQNSISSQIPGRVISVSLSKGDSVNKGDNIVVLESMKMQVAIKSPRDGVIKELKVKEGQSISRNDVVAVLE